jgi:hypothetical protein
MAAGTRVERNVARATGRELRVFGGVAAVIFRGQSLRIRILHR